MWSQKATFISCLIILPIIWWDRDCFHPHFAGGRNRLNIQMDNGQTRYESITLPSVSSSLGSQTTTYGAIVPCQGLVNKWTSCLRFSPASNSGPNRESQIWTPTHHIGCFIGRASQQPPIRTHLKLSLSFPFFLLWRFLTPVPISVSLSSARDTWLRLSDSKFWINNFCLLVFGWSLFSPKWN
jgi:hypothetical protein